MVNRRRSARADTAPPFRADDGRWQELLEISARIFAQKGYRSTTLQDIADEFGVLKGSLYHYIRSKDDILYLAGTSASFCAPGAYLIWSRGGQYTDLNARIDASFADAGFTDRQFFTEPPHKYGLSTARWPHPETPALPLDRQLFTFTR